MSGIESTIIDKMRPMGVELRDFGDKPFQIGDIDTNILKKNLTLGRRIDEVVLNQLGRKPDQLETLTEGEAVEAFNALLDKQSLPSHVEIEGLRLRPEIETLLYDAHEATAYGKALNENLKRKLNRALLVSLYLKDTQKARRYERFAAAALLKTQVTVKPLPPFFGDTISGLMVNLSAGGMALLLKERVKPGTKLALEAHFQDHTALKSEVEIKHCVNGAKQYIHGIEFLNLPDFQMKKLRNMANDYNACEQRILSKTTPICHMECSFYTLCNKSQKS